MEGLLSLPQPPFPLDRLNQAERDRFCSMLVDMRRHQWETHQEWKQIPEQCRADPRIAHTGLQFWSLEWNLKALMFLPEISELHGLNTADVEGQLQTISVVDLPDFQLTGGKTLCMIFQITYQSQTRFQRVWATMEATLVSLRVLWFGMQGLRKKAEEKMCRMLEELRYLKLETVIVENHPVDLEKLAEEPSIRVILAHKKVTNLRVYVGFTQKPDQEDQFISAELQPAWGEATIIWKDKGWQRGCTQVCDQVLDYPFPCALNPELSNLKIVSWNVRGCANPIFEQRLGDMILQENPQVLILTETRVPRAMADSFFVGKPFKFNRWEATDPAGFRGGMWLAWISSEVNIDVLSTTCQEIHFMLSPKSLK